MSMSKDACVIEVKSPKAGNVIDEVVKKVEFESVCAGRDVEVQTETANFSKNPF